MAGGNFVFVATIPASGNNPSQDQPVMKDNNGATNSWVSQDHYGFNTGGPTNNFGGLHQQVSFPANNVPTVPTTSPTLFVNGAGLPNNIAQLFFYSGADAAHTSDQYSVTPSNGSTFLLGGIILKWGTEQYANNQGTRDVTFAKQFPNNIFFATYIINDVAVPSSATSVTDYTVAGFKARRNNATGTPNFFWMAIGN